MSKEKIIQEYINQIKDQIKTRQVSIDVDYKFTLNFISY